MASWSSRPNANSQTIARKRGGPDGARIPEPERRIRYPRNARSVALIASTKADHRTRGHIRGSDRLATKRESRRSRGSPFEALGRSLRMHILGKCERRKASLWIEEPHDGATHCQPDGAPTRPAPPGAVAYHSCSWTTVAATMTAINVPDGPCNQCRGGCVPLAALVSRSSAARATAAPARPWDRSPSPASGGARGSARMRPARSACGDVKAVGACDIRVSPKSLSARNGSSRQRETSRYSVVRQCSWSY
jgi:hypothetical protein